MTNINLQISCKLFQTAVRDGVRANTRISRMSSFYGIHVSVNASHNAICQIVMDKNLI